MTAFPLTAAQRDTVDQFLKLGQQLDKDAETVLQEAEKVKEIFASKPRGTTIDDCRIFDEFIDKYFPVSSSTVRRLLRKEGKTDKRFANKGNKPKPHADPQPSILEMLGDTKPSFGIAVSPADVVRNAAADNARLILNFARSLFKLMTKSERRETVRIVLERLREEAGDDVAAAA